MAAIRRLGAEDAELYLAVRLEALREAPQAFGSAYEFERQQELRWFADRLESTFTLGAFRSSALVGVAGLRFEQGLKTAHKARLIGLYVRSGLRGAGIARALVDQLVTVARERVEVLQLSVNADNAAALRLYENAGFEAFGRERKALKIDGVYCDEIHMALDLAPQRGP